MDWHKEITKDEAKERYCNFKGVLITTEQRTLWALPYGYASHAPLEALFHRSIPDDEGEVRFFKPVLTDHQKEHQRNLNKKNGWGVSKRILLSLYNKHLKAYGTGDEVSMAEVEYRLTDVNYHSLTGHLGAGRYDEALKEIESIFSK